MKKRLIRKNIQELELQREKLLEEIEQLKFVKEHFFDEAEKIDISNVFVWEYNGIFSIVRKIEEDNVAPMIWTGEIKKGYHSILRDIFTNDILYEKYSLNKINPKEFITDKDPHYIHDNNFAYLTPIYEVEPNLLAYIDKEVPISILISLYFKLNNLKTDAIIVKEMKKRV